jgi:hypothetical protein
MKSGAGYDRFKDGASRVERLLVVVVRLSLNMVGVFNIEAGRGEMFFYGDGMK